MQNPSLRLLQWGEKKGLAPWKISRGFSQVFGFPRKPSAHVPARHAWTAIRDTPEPLAKTATHLGFADQSHMTRSVKQLTGMGSRGGTWLQMDSRRRRKRLCRMYYAPLCPPLSLHFLAQQRLRSEQRRTVHIEQILVWVFYSDLLVELRPKGICGKDPFRDIFPSK